MSQSKQRRAARQTKHNRTHDWEGVSRYEAALFAHAADVLDELAPRPSQHVDSNGNAGFAANQSAIDQREHDND